MRRSLFWLSSAVAIVVLFAAAIAWGAVPLSMHDVWNALLGRGDPGTVAIVRALRAPRAVMAILVGLGLGVAGAALQGSLRNPLAEPYLLGVSGGAAVGAVIAVSLGVSAAGAVPLAAFAGAGLAIAAVLGVARAVGGRADPRVLLMAGVIIGAFANAAIMVLLAGAPPDTTRSALWWMMGSVSDADWPRVWWLALYLSLGGGALLWSARDIDVLALGAEPAAALGLDAERAGRRVFLLSSLVA
ncbi:MAG: iron ABC transporter permease, partial [Gemmatimonadota bacterium]|nr:iron ABC transporter permease [Gemmatimonadota bacterium]